jgi:hypothetical protein
MVLLILVGEANANQIKQLNIDTTYSIKYAKYELDIG